MATFPFTFNDLMYAYRTGWAAQGASGPKVRSNSAYKEAKSCGAACPHDPPYRQYLEATPLPSARWRMRLSPSGVPSPSVVRSAVEGHAASRDRVGRVSWSGGFAGRLRMASARKGG